MAQRTRGRVLSLSVIGAVIVVGTGLVYRASVDRWESDVRASLVAAAMAGITYFVLTLFSSSGVERRQNSNKREPED